MYRYLLKRLLTIVALMWLLTVVVFAVSTASRTGSDRVFVVKNFSPFDVAREKVILGTDQSPAQQYFVWMRQILGGNLGSTGGRFGGSSTPLGTLLPPKLKNSAMLIGFAILVSVFGGLGMGIFSALKPRSWLTRVITGFSMVGVSIPDFAIGLFLMLIIGVQLRWLPTAGIEEVRLSVTKWQSFVDHLRHLILPGLTLSFMYTATFTEHVRNTLGGVLNENYVRTARSKGLSEWRVITKHALRNCLLPILAAVFSSLPYFLSGIVVVEYLYAFPGIGLFVQQSLRGYGDFHVVLMITAAASFVALAGSLVADFIYAIIDPRIKNPVNTSEKRAAFGPIAGLAAGAFVALVLYNWVLWPLYESVGYPLWALLGLGACLLAVAIVVQRGFIKSRPERLEAASLEGPRPLFFRFDLRFNTEHWHKNLRKMMTPAILVGILVVWLLFLGSFYPQLKGFQVATDIPMDLTAMYQPPSFRHLMGTNGSGQDMLVVLLLAVRGTLKAGFLVSLIATLGGTTLGVLCGFLQGPLDRLVMTVFDLLSSIPSYLLVFMVFGLAGSSFNSLILSLSVLGLVEITKVVRAQVLTVREYQFVEAARATGNTDLQIIVTHLVRNLLPLMWGQGIMLVGRTLIILCSLGYLRVLDFPTWGSVAADAISSTFFNYWWTFLGPILMGLVTILAVNMLGKGVLKAFDPFADHSR